MLNKQLFAFILIAQGVISVLYFTAYKSLELFFPHLAWGNPVLFGAAMLWSVGFALFTITSFERDWLLLRVGYLLSALSMVWGLYFLCLSAVVLVSYQAFNFNLTYGGWLAVLGSLGATLYGTINARLLKITRLNISLPNLPEFWRGKTALVASDLHLGQVLRKKTAQKIVTAINRQQPDIVFIPGDFFDGPRTNFAALAAEFKNIKAPLGAFFCSGNHEMLAGYEQAEQVIKDAGVRILEDEKTEIHGLQLLGLAFKHEDNSSVAARLKQMGIDPHKPSILLKHIPSHIRAVAQAGVNLQISGHTHLGQVWPFRHLTKRMFKGFDFGLKPLENLLVYTSSGVGTWGPPVRFLTKSEMVLITFN